MSTTLTDMILIRIKDCKDGLAVIKEALEKFQQIEPINSRHCISNTELLLNVLESFYGPSGNSDYFPKQASDSVNNGIFGLLTQINAFKTALTSEVQANAVLSVADQLYTTCLTLGLISFGFDPKNLQTHIEALKASQMKGLEAIVDSKNRIDNIISQAEGKLLGYQPIFEGKISELSKAFQGSLDELGKGKIQAESIRVALDKLILEIQKPHTEAIEALKASEAAMVQIKNSESAARDSVTRVDKIESDAKAGSKAISDAKSSAEQEMKSIREFFASINEHSAEMARNSKIFSDKASELSEKYNEDWTLCKVAVDKSAREHFVIFETSLTTFNKNSGFFLAEKKNEMDKISAESIKLQDVIKGHLDKAVGVSLFTSFDTRRQLIHSGKNKWMYMVVASTLLGLGASLLVAFTTAQVDTALYLKLSAAIPIALLIYFCSKQYNQERRAEEEYAFKAAISISLQPYTTLLEDMKSKNFEVESNFIKKLMYEIFDNPVNRIYDTSRSISSLKSGAKENEAEREVTLELISQFSPALANYAKKLDLEQLKSMIEIYKTLREEVMPNALKVESSSIGSVTTAAGARVP